MSDCLSYYQLEKKYREIHCNQPCKILDQITFSYILGKNNVPSKQRIFPYATHTVYHLEKNLI